MGPHVIHIQARRDEENQWLTTQYKLTDEELDTIIHEWPTEWKLPISREELSDTVEGLPLDAPVDQTQVQESDQESQEKSYNSNGLQYGDIFLIR